MSEPSVSVLLVIGEETKVLIGAMPLDLATDLQIDIASAGMKRTLKEYRDAQS